VVYIAIIVVARIAVYRNGVLEWHAEGDSKEHSAKTDPGYPYSALIATIAWGCVLVAVCLLIAGFCKYQKASRIGCEEHEELS
jgi:hypothetical protein